MINNSSQQDASGHSWAKTSLSVQEILANSSKSLEESRKLDERAEKVMEHAKQSRQDTEDVMERISRTIASLRNTIDGLNETQKKFDDMEQMYKNMMEKAALNLAAAFGPKSMLKDGTPIKASAKTAAEAISNCKRIVILTGAGLSVASGIPTFRGEGGFWTTRDSKERLKAIEFLTNSYFRENPIEIWRWHNAFKKLKERSKYNEGHREIAEFQCFCLKNDIQHMLVTQNIDEFHVDAFEDTVKKYPTVASKVLDDWKDVNSDQYGLHPHVFAIHGSVNYIRYHDSVENAPKRLYPYPARYDEETQPLLEDKPSRPHTLLFDESYNQWFYRADTVTTFSGSSDCLIVIGTALETSMAARIVTNAISKKATVIEVNPDPCINADGVLQLKGTCEEFLKDMFQMARQMMITNLNLEPEDVKQPETKNLGSLQASKPSQGTKTSTQQPAKPSATMTQKSSTTTQKSSTTTSKPSSNLTSKQTTQIKPKNTQTAPKKLPVSGTKNTNK